MLLFFIPLISRLYAYRTTCVSGKARGFPQQNTEVIYVSIDSQFSHLAWLNTPKSEGGIEGVTYPIVADINKTIARDYDVLIPDDGVALRGAFLIDSQGMVRQQTVNDLPLGRNVDEFLRLVDALAFTEEHGEVCAMD